MEVPSIATLVETGMLPLNMLFLTIVTEASDPYTTTDHLTCKHKSGSGTYAATITSYKTVATNDEAALATAVALNPVSIAIDVSQSSFQFYSS